MTNQTTADEISELADTLGNALNAAHLPVTTCMAAALTLVSGMIAMCSCPSCREQMTKMVDEHLPRLIEMAKEYAAEQPQQPHLPLH